MSPVDRVEHHGPMGARLALELAWLGVAMSPAPDGVSVPSFAAWQQVEARAGIPATQRAPESSRTPSAASVDPAGSAGDPDGECGSHLSEGEPC